MKKQRFTVYVSCKTYNQSRFIKATLDGFCMQQTEFPFVCAIFDDASADGEPDVIRQYLVDHFNLDDNNVVREEETDDYIRIFAQHKENRNCFFVVVLLKYNHFRLVKNKEQYVSEWLDNAKYHAICEGDDYWIAPFKLQKQVDYLETNDDCVLVYTDAMVVNEDSKRIVANKSRKHEGDCARPLITEGNFVITATVCYRYRALSGWIECKNSIPFEMSMGDKPLWIFLSTKGYFHYIRKEFVAYRVLQESASHTPDLNKKLAFIQNGEDIALYLNNYLNIGVKENAIKRKYGYTRIRESIRYKANDYKSISLYYIKKYPNLLFDFKLMSLLILRLITGRPI